VTVAQSTQVTPTGIDRVDADLNPPSGPLNLEERRDRISLYEQVLTEGTADDVRYYNRVDELVVLWDELVLSPHVRAAWEAWLGAAGGWPDRCSALSRRGCGGW